MKTRRRKGFTIPEILVSSLIIGLSIAALSSSLGNLFKTGKSSEATAYVNDEQEAISSLIQSMNQGQAAMALCPAPHPFYATKKDGKLGCDITFLPSKLPLSSETAQQMIQASADLIDLIFQWHNEGQLKHDPSAKLSEEFYTTKIKPKLEEAKCLKCHGGDPSEKDGRRGSAEDREFMEAFAPMDMERLWSRPAVYNIDFSNFAQMTQPTTTSDEGGAPKLKPALATRTVLNSKVGQYLLRPIFSFDEVLQGSKNQGLRTTVKLMSESLRVATSQYFPYGMTKSNQATSPCKENLVSCLNQTSPTPDIKIAGSCKANCTHETINWCSCGKDCMQPCPGQPFVCDKYEWNYTCLSLTDSNPIQRSGFYAGAVGASQDPAWHTVADAECKSAEALNPSDNWCQKPSLLCATGEPNDTVTVCMSANTCETRCARVLMDLGGSCGKDCYIPPKPIGCDDREYRVRCDKINTKPMTVMKYEMDTRYIDLNTMGVKTLKASGVIQ